MTYARNIEFCSVNGVDIENEERYSKSDEYEHLRGKYYLQQLSMGSLGYIESLDFPIQAPDGMLVYPNKDGNKINRWRWSKEKVNWGLKNGFIEFCKDKDNNWVVSTKQYLKADNEGNLINRKNRPFALIEKYSSTLASKQLQQLLKGRIFNYSKPVELIKYLVSIGSKANSIILDFFSGSATTAHAVMQLNAEDGGNRKFIMVQLPELTDEKSEAYKAGYKNICEIGKERIRRAGRKIKADSPLTTQNLDVGSRVLKLDSSNMLDVYYTPEEFNEKMIFQENVKADRTDEDLLFQVMLELGIELSASIRKERLGPQRATVFNVDDGYLMATFEQEIDEATITEIAKRNPGFFVMRDASAASDNVLDNFEQLFRHYSPETSCRII